MRNITFEQMLKMEVDDILNNYGSGGYTYYWKNVQGEYREIVEIYLLSGFFKVDEGYLVSFNSAKDLIYSRIYVEES
jgi:hypothetical protein